MLRECCVLINVGVMLDFSVENPINFEHDLRPFAKEAAVQKPFFKPFFRIFQEPETSRFKT